jgi:hypothetical protein
MDAGGISASCSRRLARGWVEKLRYQKVDYLRPQILLPHHDILLSRVPLPASPLAVRHISRNVYIFIVSDGPSSIILSLDSSGI